MGCRFGIMSDDTTLRQLCSKIATIQFLQQHTKVPVRAIIVYSTSLGTNSPPFMILENVDGIQITLLLLIKVNFSTLVKSTTIGRLDLETMTTPVSILMLYSLEHNGARSRWTLHAWNL